MFVSQPQRPVLLKWLDIHHLRAVLAGSSHHYASDDPRDALHEHQALATAVQ
jgi:hypothetical protein